MDFFKKFLSVSAVTLCLAAPNPVWALDPITTGTVAAGIDALGGGIASSLNKVVDRFFNRLDNSVNNMRLQVDGLIDSAKNDMDSFLGKSIQELEGQERLIWQSYQSAMIDLDSRVERYLLDGKVTMLLAGDLAGAVIPFSDDNPRIYWAEVVPPLYQKTAPIRRITLFGTNLDHDQNKLVANGKEAERASPFPTELTYEMHGVGVGNGLEVSISLFKDSWFSWLSSSFDTDFSPKALKFPPQDDYVGDVALVYTVNEYPVINRPWPSNGSYIEASCQNSSDVFSNSRCSATKTDTITATSGYSILPDTVKVSYNVKHPKGGCKEATVTTSNISGNAFKYAIFARAHQGVRRVCWVRGAFTWKEKKDVPNKLEQKTDFFQVFRSRNGVSIGYPSNVGPPLRLILRKPNETLETPFALNSQITGLKTYIEPGSGVVEVSWGE